MSIKGIETKEENGMVTVTIAGFSEKFPPYFDLKYWGLNAFNSKVKGESRFIYERKLYSPWDKKEIARHKRSVKVANIYNKYLWPVLKYLGKNRRVVPFSHRLFIISSWIREEE